MLLKRTRQEMTFTKLLSREVFENQNPDNAVRIYLYVNDKIPELLIVVRAVPLKNISKR